MILFMDIKKIAERSVFISRRFSLTLIGRKRQNEGKRISLWLYFVWIYNS